MSKTNVICPITITSHGAPSAVNQAFTQISGLQSLITKTNSYFYEVKSINATMAAINVPEDGHFNFQAGLDQTLVLDSIDAAKLLAFSAAFFTSDGSARVVYDDLADLFHGLKSPLKQRGNVIDLLGDNSADLLEGSYTAPSIHARDTPATLNVTVSGVVALTVASVVYHLAFSQDPLMTITTGGGG